MCELGFLTRVCYLLWFEFMWDFLCSLIIRNCILFNEKKKANTLTVPYVFHRISEKKKKKKKQNNISKTQKNAPRNKSIKFESIQLPLNMRYAIINLCLVCFISYDSFTLHIIVVIYRKFSLSFFFFHS